MRELASELHRTVAEQIAGSGSGVVITGNRILTNAHNIADATLISAESGPIDIMWQEGAQTGDQKVILKMGGSGGGAQSYPFMLFIGKDENTDEPVLKMKQGSVYLQSIHEDWCNYRY